MLETVLSLALGGGILLLCWLLTNWFTRTMYNRCQICQTLNARRRTHCRQCAQPLQ